MPELPEVETTKDGISPFLLHQKFKSIIIRNDSLRWPVPLHLTSTLPGQTIHRIYRRAKYIILECDTGHLICHLGMSGHFKIIRNPTPLLKHDHIDFNFENDICLRYHDPRRFGCILWTESSIPEHFLFKKLGLEPLGEDLNALKLKQMTGHKNIPIKLFLMNQANIVGIGNIYASEALFLAKIHPLMPVNHLSFDDCKRLINAIQSVLSKAIAQGGTTLNDYMNSEGKPGYFSQSLQVYHRENQPCFRCHNPIDKIIMGQRSTFFCAKCQMIH